MNRGLAETELVEALIAALRSLAVRDRLWHPVESPRGAELMGQGAPATSMFVLECGLVKLAYATPDGGERIKSFIVDRGFFGPSFDDIEGRYSATTLEPSLTVALPIGWIAARMAESDALKANRAAFEAWVRAKKEARELALLCDTAETRYRNLLVREPSLVARLQQADIARFIGVTPIAFSRIKRRAGLSIGKAPRGG